MELIDELVILGVKLYILSPLNGPLINEFNQRHLKNEIVPYLWWCTKTKMNSSTQQSRLQQSQKLLSAIETKIRQWHPDIIITNTLTIPWGAILAKQLRLPHLWFVREYGTLDHHLHFFNGYRQSLKFIGQNSNFVIANSQAVKNHLRRYISPHKLMVIYPYINIQSDLIRQPAAYHFNHPSALKVVNFSMINPSKNQEDIIRAVGVIYPDTPLELILMGYQNPEYLVKLKKIIDSSRLNNIIQIGNFTPNPYPTVSAADLVIISSRQEALGRVTIESMALGKAVIGADSGGTQELIRHGINGYLYEPGNYHQLAAQIRQLALNPRLRNRMGKAGLNFYHQHFSPQQYGGQVHGLMESILTKSTL